MTRRSAVRCRSARRRCARTEAIADVEYFLDLQRGREAFEVMRKLGTVEWSWTLDVKGAEQRQNERHEVERARKAMRRDRERRR